MAGTGVAPEEEDAEAGPSSWEFESGADDSGAANVDVEAEGADGSGVAVVVEPVEVVDEPAAGSRGFTHVVSWVTAL